STLSHQPQDRIQVEGAFLGQRSSWFARSIATAQTPTQPDSSVLDAAHWADASAPSTLGSQKDPRSIESTISPPKSSRSAHNHSLYSTAGSAQGAPPFSPQRPCGDALGVDCGASVQPGVDGRLQRMVPHQRWTPGRAVDGSRSVQSLSFGDSVAGRSAMVARASSVYGPVQAVWATQNNPSGQWRALWFQRACGVVPVERLVDCFGDRGPVHCSRAPGTKRGARTNASSNEGRDDDSCLEHDAGTTATYQSLGVDVQSDSSARGLAATNTRSMLSTPSEPGLPQGETLGLSEELRRAQRTQQRTDSITRTAAIFGRSLCWIQSWSEADAEWTSGSLFSFRTVGRIAHVGCRRTPAFGLRPPTSDQTQEGVTYVLAS